MKNISIGFNLLVWSATISEELLPMAERLKRIGYDGLETSMGETREEPYRKFGREAGDMGLKVNCCLAVGADENPVSESAAVRQKGLDKIKWSVDRAHDMGGNLVCGPFHSAFATFSRKAPTEQEYAWSAEILQKAGEYAAQADVILALEALNRFECYLCNTMDQLVKLVNQVGHPSVVTMYDTHHANIEEKNITNSIINTGSLLQHVHISENDRGTPGEGHIQWEQTFAALSEINYKGWMTIEAFTRNDPDFANAINVWREYSSPWDIAEKGHRFIKDMCEKHGL